MPRHVYDLYPLVHDFANLIHAERAAARGKRHRPDVAAFEYHLEDQLLSIQATLRDKTYRPGPYRRYTVRSPKERVISAAPFRDRVAHHALCRVIEPAFERRFIADSYASRLGKGIHQALDRCTHFARRHPYVLKCDIVQFFPAVDHAILLKRLGRVIGDPDVLWLCERILAGGAGELTNQYNYVAFPGDADPDMWRPRGLPIGNQTSQFWANVYLDALDQFVKRELRCPAYLRYVDDFLLFADDKPTLHAWRRRIIAFLATLRLTLHEPEAAVFPVTAGIPFLGFHVWPDHRRLRRRNIVAFRRRFRALREGYAAGRIPFEHMNASVRGWVAHASHADTFHLRAAVLAPAIVPPPLAVQATLSPCP